MVEAIMEHRFGTDGRYYLTTGRTLANYNNNAQTRRSSKLHTKYDEDILLMPIEDEGRYGNRVILRSAHGETEALSVRYSDKVRPGTLYVTFHHAVSRINALFGDASDELVMTARFKSVTVEVIPVGDEVACS
jgi:formate dehydrogenase major subunit